MLFYRGSLDTDSRFKSLERKNSKPIYAFNIVTSKYVKGKTDTQRDNLPNTS